MSEQKVPGAIIFWKDFDSEHSRGMVFTDSATITQFWNDEHKRTFVHRFPSAPPVVEESTATSGTVKAESTVSATQPEKITTVASS